MARIPFIDHSRCTNCDSCIEICPDVFRRNGQTGLVEVIDLHEYPEKEVREAANLCPADCIILEEE